MSGLIVCNDANEAEVYTMLMGCREFSKIEATYAIIEGDSFLAIQWGSSSSRCPWRLAEWLAELHQNSAQLHHILKDANELADQLAREGENSSFFCVFMLS